MYYGKVEICGVDTSKLKNLGEDEKRELLRRTKEGDSAAREQLIDGNLRLVLSVIQKFAGRCDNMDDLFQVGCVGLIKAVDNFDTTLDVRFSTYAVPMIIGEVRRYLRDNSILRVSRSVRDLAFKALSVKERLSKIVCEEPDINMIVEKLNEEGTPCTKEEAARAIAAIVEPVSLYEPVFSADQSGQGNLYLMDQIKDESSSDDNWVERLALKGAVDNLSEKEKKIIKLRYFAGKTQTEIAADIGISQAQISRLEKNAIEKLRKQM